LYIGGALKELPDDIAVDEDEKIYVAGRTLSQKIYVQSTAVDSTGPNNQNDAFLAKFDADMNLLWCTYYGGLGDEKPFTISLDPVTQEVVMGGKTSSEEAIAFNCDNDAVNYTMDCVYSSNFDGFLAKFSTSGNVMRGTYVGGFSQDYILGVTTFLQPDGQVVIFATGTAEGDGGIVKQSYQDVEQYIYSGGDKDHGDFFLLKFNGDLTERIWGTYYGTVDGQERGHEITYRQRR
jgi:hypothetical protein